MSLGGVTDKIYHTLEYSPIKVVMENMLMRCFLRSDFESTVVM